MLAVRKIFIKRTVNANLGAAITKAGQYLLYARTLPSLIFIAENGETKSFILHSPG